MVFHLQSGLPFFRSKTEKVSHLQLYGLQFAAQSNLKHSKFCINSYLCKIYIFLYNRHECKLALRHHKFSSINLHRSLNLSLSDLDIYSITTIFYFSDFIKHSSKLSKWKGLFILYNSLVWTIVIIIVFTGLSI